MGKVRARKSRKAGGGKPRVTVRRATEKDLDLIWQWEKAMLKETRDLTPDEGLKSAISPGDYAIAVRGGKPVGMVARTEVPFEVEYLSKGRTRRVPGRLVGSLYVPREHRGGEVAAALGRHLEGSGRTLLAVAENRGVEVLLSRRAGWQRLGRGTRAINPEGKGEDIPGHPVFKFEEK